ncbi:MAG: VWA domain-containing protein [Anaerolineae bacterium]|nr:VWA domain-containing protein [Anaerolineae bacterium]
MIKHITILMTIVILLTLAVPISADGIIIIDPPPVLPPDWSSQLSVCYHRVTITIENQIATTKVDQVFRNDGQNTAEGVYVFPLPPGVVLQQFVMWVDGQPVEGEILPADKAREIYEDYVRRQRDPALLEYVGRDSVRARIFPIAPGEERRIQLEYTEVLPAESNLMHYRYSLDTERFSAKPVEQVSVFVKITSKVALRAVYSPSHQADVLVTRQNDYEATISYEASQILPDRDFELYISSSADDISANLFSYKPENEDGFFLLLLSPAIETAKQRILPKDVFLLLDTSGSMDGEKLTQAQEALGYILKHLNAEDRFNVIAFSSDIRTYAATPQSSLDVSDAITWLNALEAIGGTNIYRALSEAMTQTDPERPAIVIFLTDGLPTEGVVDEQALLEMINQETPNSVRLFPFGVGYDVNTLFLDQLAQNHKGRPAYIEPHERIDEQVSAFFAQVQSPVLTNIELDFGAVRAYDVYPKPLTDLYAGTQLIIAGRYTGEGPQRITLSGEIEGERQQYVYEGTFASHNIPEDKSAFIPRLWAARKIGDLLTQIRLHGENAEWVDAIVTLSLRYGIITPYTSFLVEEPNKVLSSEGREHNNEEFEESLQLAPAATGEKAVEDAEMRKNLGGADAPPNAPQWTIPSDAPNAANSYIRYVGDKTFLCASGGCVDTVYVPDEMKAQDILFMSSAYWELLKAHPDWKLYFALGEGTIFVNPDGAAYRFRFGTETGEVSRPQEPENTATATPIQTTNEPGPSTPLTTVEALATPQPGTTATSTPNAKPALCNGAVILAFLGVLFVLQRDQFKYPKS